MKSINYKYWFLLSIFLGIALWILTYTAMPLLPKEALKAETIYLIVISYLMTILGFFGFSKIKKNSSTTRKNSLNERQLIKVLIVIVLSSFILRWIDLFLIRDLSFFNEPKYNRVLNEKSNSIYAIFFIIPSILKSLYFFPFVIKTKCKIKYSKLTVYLSYVCLSLPIVEALLKGTRKPFLEILLLIIITIIIYDRNRINLKTVAISLIAVFGLLTLSMAIIFQRENLSDDMNSEFYKKLFESKYNDLLMPKDEVKNYFLDDTNSKTVKFYAMGILQIGQYILHGVFELNHIIKKENLVTSYGKHSFSTVFRVVEKISSNHIENNVNYSPRGSIYLTTFGSFYLDFKWGALAVFLIIGAFQAHIFLLSNNNLLFCPLLILFIIINLFLPVMNLLRGAGIYPFIAVLLLLLSQKLYLRSFNEKSIST